MHIFNKKTQALKWLSLGIYSPCYDCYYHWMSVSVVVLYLMIMIIKSKIWFISHCLGLGHEKWFGLYVLQCSYGFWQPSLYGVYSLQWRHNERDRVSNHQPHECLLHRLFRRRSKETSKLCVTGLCAENFSIWWRHHVAFMNFSQPGALYMSAIWVTNYSAIICHLLLTRSHEISLFLIVFLCERYFSPWHVEFVLHEITNIRRTKIRKPKGFSSRLTAVFLHCIEARC